MNLMGVIQFPIGAQEEEMTEEEKAAQKAKPVATTPIPGTPWYVGYLISKLFYLFIAMFDYYIAIDRGYLRKSMSNTECFLVVLFWILKSKTQLLQCLALPELSVNIY